MIAELPPLELDLDGMLRNLRREGTPNRVYYFEHGVDDNIKEALDQRFGILDDLDSSADDYEYRKAVKIHRFLGHEFFRVFPPGARIEPPKKADGWAEEHAGVISSWEDLEKFEWLRAEDADLSVLEYYEKHLPDDMRVIHVIDLWEVVRELIGFESFCYKLFEDPELIKAAFAKVGEFNTAVTRACCDFDCYGAIYLSDDLGYKTSTILSPKAIRELIIPWHKKIADEAHRHGKLVFFHCCGQVYDLMDDYLDYVKIDAKHSFEEAVLPVTNVKKRYGDRLTLLGGVDVDFLARADEASIRAKTREILDVCMPGGGYFLGSGNWVTSYVPLDNYLVMLDEGRKYCG